MMVTLILPLTAVYQYQAPPTVIQPSGLLNTLQAMATQLAQLNATARQPPQLNAYPLSMSQTLSWTETFIDLTQDEIIKATAAVDKKKSELQLNMLMHFVIILIMTVSGKVSISTVV